jgi:putative sporulation protein YtaF
MQRDVLAALLIGVVSNLDNLGVGVAFGIRGTRIDAMANLIVAGITMAVTAGSVTCGHVLSKIFPAAVTGWLGPLIIIGIGIGTALPSARMSRRPAPSQVPSGAPAHLRDVDDIISWREAIVLGVALAVNNLGTGVGAGVSGIPASPTIVSAGLLSLAAFGGGSLFGRRFGRLVLGRYAPLIAGMLLLAVGTAMLPNVR